MRKSRVYDKSQTPLLNDRQWYNYSRRLMPMSNGCIEWKGYINPDGYGKYKMGGFNFLAHRMSYMINVGEIPAGLYVCHKCDNRKCVNHDHLFLGTLQDNMADMMNKGRSQKLCGVKKATAKLTDDIVKEILKSNETMVSMAKKYNVSFAVIQSVKSRKTWKHITI